MNEEPKKRFLKYTVIGYSEITPEMDEFLGEILASDISDIHEAVHFCEDIEGSVEVVGR